jgi:DNA helicase-2/ATP-dependent DNA helicase PcrA
MSNSRGNKPDTAADVELRACLVGPEKRNFTMVAGAGSGKTTSLVKALTTIVSSNGDELRRKRQRVACITYTEIAAGEIWADVGNNPLVHVSTIHSFLWMVTRTFQRDIRSWILRRIDERIAELNATAAAFGARVQQRTRDKNRSDVSRFEESKAAVASVPSFNYGTGSNYSKGLLGHDDIIRIATDFLAERPLFRTLLGQQFPFVFVDESQDTQNVVVAALKAVAQQLGSKFCLGFFGDPMQRIYPSGIGSISAEQGWAQIAKPENFRCSSTVLAVAKAIRLGGDNLIQEGGRTYQVDGESRLVEGTARIFVLSADARRNELMRKVREFVSTENADDAWKEGPDSNVKLLVIVHRMAASRLGFADLYSAMNDKAPTNFSEGFMDGSAWPLRPFETFVMPMVAATTAGREFDAMALLRKHCPLLSRDALSGHAVSDLLSRLRAATHRLRDMLSVDGQTTNREVLTFLRDEELVALDPRLLAYLEVAAAPAAVGEAEQVEDDAGGGDDAAREISSMDLFLACPAKQFIGFRNYIQQQSPFSTQQGVKGAEFEKVMVVLDDDEGTHVQFSYDKFFRVKEPSKRDLENIAEGKETSVDRTRRLFYVCCTRALTDLVVVYFSTEPDVAERQVRASGIFSSSAIYTEASL